MVRWTLRSMATLSASVLLVLGIMLGLVGCGTSSTPTTNASLPTAAAATSTVAVQGGAHITQPFDRVVTGAQCYAGTGTNQGDAAFGFPQRGSDAVLTFSLGPLTDGLSPGQEHNKPYAGAGTYDNIGIVARPVSGLPVFGFGSVTVNSDLHSGSFTITNPVAAGTWDCGIALHP